MGKEAKPKKPEPQSNEDAVRAYAAERRASLGPDRPKFSAKRSTAIEEAFLDGLRASWSVVKSAWAVGISETTAYAWKNASLATRQGEGDEAVYADDFYVRWVAAYDAGVQSLEDEAIRRAKRGVEKPVYQGGVMVGTVTEYSDTLMTFVLRGKAPKTYNTERHELTGAGGGPIDMNMTIGFEKSGQKK